MSQHKKHSVGLHRRGFLTAGAALPVLASGLPTYVSAQEPRAGADGPWGIPGPYPGRVIEVRHRGMIRSGVKDRAAIGAAVARG